jgi:hypothetical protein
METVLLLIKKIAVGVLLFAVPLAIYYVGLYLLKFIL